jgi:hypothetical protein
MTSPGLSRRDREGFGVGVRDTRVDIPSGNHLVVHVLQLLLGGLEGIWWWIELVGLEGLVGKTDFEWLIIFLYAAPLASIASSHGAIASSGSNPKVPRTE